MKALVKNELRLTRKLLLIWMGIVLILCGFAYFEYLSLKESLNELTGLISNFPKILKAMFGVSGDLTSALGWYGCMYYWVTSFSRTVNIRAIGFLSPFSFFSPAEIHNAGTYSWDYMLWYLLLLFGFALLAYWKILKRDIALAV